MLEQHRRRILKEPFQRLKECSANGAVNNPVIAGQRHRHHGAYDWLPAARDDALLAGADR
jgi:hypothetical protein